MLFHNFIFFCLDNMFFINYALKFKYQTGCLKVNQFAGYREIKASLGEGNWPSITSYLHCNVRLSHGSVLCLMHSRSVHVRNIFCWANSVNLQYFYKAYTCKRKSVLKFVRKIVHQRCHVKEEYTKTVEIFWNNTFKCWTKKKIQRCYVSSGEKLDNPGTQMETQPLKSVPYNSF